MKSISFKTSLLCLSIFFTLGAPVWAASNEKELIVVAQRAFEDGFYDVSLRYVAQVLQEFPKTDKYVDVRLIEGQCYFFKKQYLKAFNVFKELAGQDSYKDASLFWLGESYLKSGDYEQARAQYQKVIDLFPGSLYTPQAYYSMAWTYFEKGDYLSAKKFFQVLVEKFPSNNLAEDSAFKLGECEYNAGQYEGAVFNFNAYLQAYPTSTRQYEATFNIAEAYYYLEQYDQAGVFYAKAKALTRDAKNTLASVIGQAWSTLKTGKYDASLKLFDEAGAYAKTSGLPEEDVIIGKASLFTTQEKYQDALLSYSDLISRFPGSPRVVESYAGRANTYYLLNDHANAIKDYMKIIDNYDKDPLFEKIVEKARFGLAWTYLKSGQLDKSIENFRGVLDKTESKVVKVSALTQIGDAYQEDGRMEEAIATYDKVLQEMPDTAYSDYVQYRLGVALLKVDKTDAALMAFSSLKKNYPKSKYIPESAYYLGVAYFKKRDWGGVVDIIEVFLKDNTARSDFSGEAKYILGLSYFNLKKFPEALAVFGDILKSYPAREDLVRTSRVGIAKTQYETGNVKEALAQFKEIVFSYPKTDAEEESLLWMGQHYMAQELFEQARAQYEQVLIDLPQSDRRSLAHFELARAYHAQGKFDKALEHYRQVDIKLTPDLYAKARLTIADIFSRELDPEKAVETYKSIIVTSPEFKRDAWIKIAQLYRRSKAYEQERSAYEEALQAEKGSSDFTNAQIQFQIADACEMSNQIDKAIEAYLKVPYLYDKEKPLVIKAYLRIAKLYENKEEWDKALTAYQKIVEMKVDESKFADERVAAISTERRQQQ